MFRSSAASDSNPKKFNNHLGVFVREVLQENWTLTSSQIIKLFKERYPDETRELKQGLISVTRSQIRKQDPMVDEYPNRPGQRSTSEKLDQLLGDDEEKPTQPPPSPKTSPFPAETTEVKSASKPSVQSTPVCSPPAAVSTSSRALEILLLPAHREDLQRIEAALDRLIVTLADADQVDAESWPYRFLLDSRRRISALLVSQTLSGPH